MHTLPCGFHKIRYYGFLNNRSKKMNLKLIVKLTGKALFQSKYSSMSHAELLQSLWNINVHLFLSAVVVPCTMRAKPIPYGIK